VLKPHRGRGLASELMIRAMHDLCRDGLTDVELHVDDTNVTGARRLYEKLGFALARRSLTYEQDISAPGEKS
jgi:ribosomal protein S18 acetylase RimI-like enzyme